MKWRLEKNNRKIKTKSFFVFFFLRFYLFIWQIEITSRQRGRQRERGGSRFPAEQRTECWAPSQDPGIMTWAKGRGFNPLSHPGAPVYSLNMVFFSSLTYGYICVTYGYIWITVFVHVFIHSTCIWSSLEMAFIDGILFYSPVYK